MLSDLVNRANTGLVQGRCRAGFAPEPFQRVRVGHHFLGKKLEGNKASEFGVLGLIYDTHPATTQLLEDPVVRDGLANHGRVMVGGILGQVNGLRGIDLRLTCIQ